MDSSPAGSNSGTGRHPGGLTEAQSSVRNAGLLMLQWTLHVLGAATFAVVVPRMMGPETFGRYSLLTSVAMWFAFLSGLGAMSVLTRAVPPLVAAGDVSGVQRLLTSFVTLRAVTGLLTASSYALLIVLAFGFTDWPSVLLVAAAVWSRTAANICFALFIGLNQAARWGIGDLLRRWLILVFVVAGFPIAGLRGACAGFLAANVAVLGVGVLQARPHLRWSSLDLSRRYLAPFIRTGTSFAAGSLLLALVQRSGEGVLTLSVGDYAQVGYFGAAYAIYLTLGQAFWQSAITFAPLLVRQVHAGEREAARVLLGRILKWMLIAVSLAGFGILVLGRELVPVVLGSAYAPVAVNLIPLSCALVFLAVGCVGRLTTLALDRPGILVGAAAVELTIFWTVGPLLASRGGSLAVCVAAALATAIYASWITWRVRREMPYAPGPALAVVALAFVFAPLIWAPVGLPAKSVLFAIVATGYVWLLRRFGLVTIEEIKTLRRVAKPLPAAG
jgi:O-antigen/teichoic acid export membrane protein